MTLRQRNKLTKEFFDQLLGVSSKSIFKYYLKRALSGKGLAPRLIPAEKNVVTFLANNPGGIGYLSKMSGEVKQVTVK